MIIKKVELTETEFDAIAFGVLCGREFYSVSTVKDWLTSGDSKLSFSDVEFTDMLNWLMTKDKLEFPFVLETGFYGRLEKMPVIKFRLKKNKADTTP